MDGRVAWISIAPVKGLGLVHPDEVELGPAGVSANRRFHCIDARGRLVNGKRFGRLVQVTPSYEEAAGRLALRFPDGAEVEDEVAPDGEVVTVFYGRPVRGRFVAGPFSEALSAFAGEELRLVMPDRPAAAVDRGRGGAISLLSVAALDGLGEATGAGAPLDGRRFRMLFGISGVPAHAEDGWIDRRVRIGDATVRPRGHVGRCLITSQDPDTGRPDVDTLDALRRLRGDVESTEPLPCGVYGDVVDPGTVRLGDPVASIP